MKLVNISKVLIIGTLGLLMSSVASAGVVGSKHDLTTGGEATPNQPNGKTGLTDEVCVFCHTPHGSDVNAPVPLWNKVLTPGGYTQYSSLATPTFDSAEAPVGSVSLACLSCHDGTQAMDVVINMPGPGGHSTTGTEIDPLNVGAMVGTPVPTLGQDLTDDHPISMLYGGGGPLAADADGVFPRANLGDPDFFGPVKATVNGNPIWWVDSPVGTALTREKTDMILYARDEPTVAGGLQPFVECGSCHDPHNDQTSNANGTSVDFLRIANQASQICTTCHDK